jgi:hypothetical protein
MIDLWGVCHLALSPFFHGFLIYYLFHVLLFKRRWNLPVYYQLVLMEFFHEYQLNSYRKWYEAPPSLPIILFRGVIGYNIFYAMTQKR